MLCCDGCFSTIVKGSTYQIDAHGYLLCAACAKRGDLAKALPHV